MWTAALLMQLCCLAVTIALELRTVFTLRMWLWSAHSLLYLEVHIQWNLSIVVTLKNVLLAIERSAQVEAFTVNPFTIKSPSYIYSSCYREVTCLYSDRYRQVPL